ncbi:putative protein N(5)-glutamine methyltransferase [Phytoactinopolyspora alkaliphila]|uniref:peptide chain release factor N(5)-glutamine methyltransferase n=1 Tax=Phytoactinopolyspora alkaliphila TaxID=1783498 RepID=A0A6N9YH75_9ACTN|nr:putative protein N(5)-glutamine methyltransferase [Phytoactinopolyspora alkaliphila]NED94275.1 putative protein N(5)-glutamine methyltransferase [Phytoactinopolyspora alkaliphila]
MSASRFSSSSSSRQLSAVVSQLRAFGCVYAEEEAELLSCASRTQAHLDAMVVQRGSGLPIEHIVGWAEFCGQRVLVDPGVFVPRRRTEFLVHQAVALAPPAPVVLDMCCGSGAVGVALVALLGDVDLHAADIDPAAVRCARRNLDPLGGRVYQGDLYGPVPDALRGAVSILVANTPYVPTDAIGLLPHEARLHEPRQALDGGPDGLDIQRRVAAAARPWLARGGHMLVETSERQGPRTAEILAGNGLAVRVAHSDRYDATVVIGTQE